MASFVQFARPRSLEMASSDAAFLPPYNVSCAEVAELADAGDLKSPGPKGRVGSIPTFGTTHGSR